MTDRRLALFLRVVLVLQTCGLAAEVFVGGRVLASGLVGLGLDAEAAQMLDQLLAGLSVAGAFAVLIAGSRLAAAGLAALMLAAAVVSSLGAAPLAHLAIPAHATRWGLPLILALGPGTVAAAGTDRRVEAILRICIAGTFAAHGLEALAVHPSFLALLQGSAARLLDTTLPPATLPQILLVIGLVDLVVAAAALAGPRRIAPVIGYMAVWGLITALSRTVAFGVPGLPATLLRAANCGLPLALLLSWRASLRWGPGSSTHRLPRWRARSVVPREARVSPAGAILPTVPGASQQVRLPGPGPLLIET